MATLLSFKDNPDNTFQPAVLLEIAQYHFLNLNVGVVGEDWTDSTTSNFKGLGTINCDIKKLVTETAADIQLPEWAGMFELGLYAGLNFNKVTQSESYVDDYGALFAVVYKF